MELKYVVENLSTYQNINQILINHFRISTRLLNKLIKNHLIYKNFEIADTRESISIGDIITINLNYNEDNSNIIPTKMPLDIIYEDDWFIIINKPAGMPVHPSTLHYTDSLSNGVRYYFDSINLKKKIRPVNRLDLNTSGIVIFAKSEYIQEQLSYKMKEDILKKEYICFINGSLDKKSGIIDLPIARKDGSIIERCIDNTGQKSITIYEVLRKYDKYSKVRCLLKTGRTHQIRVHFSHIGHPLLGDTLYGFSSNFIDRQALHSYKVSFIHPITLEHLSFIAPIPDDMANLDI